MLVPIPLSRHAQLQVYIRLFFIVRQCGGEAQRDLGPQRNFHWSGTGSCKGQSLCWYVYLSMPQALLPRFGWPPSLQSWSRAMFRKSSWWKISEKRWKSRVTCTTWSKWGLRMSLTSTIMQMPENVTSTWSFCFGHPWCTVECGRCWQRGLVTMAFLHSIARGGLPTWVVLPLELYQGEGWSWTCTGVRSSCRPTEEWQSPKVPAKGTSRQTPQAHDLQRAHRFCSGEKSFHCGWTVAGWGLKIGPKLLEFNPVTRPYLKSHCILFYTSMARGGQNHSKEKQCGFSCFIQVIFGVAHLELSQFSTAILMQAAKEEKKLGNCLVWDHLGHIRDVGAELQKILQAGLVPTWDFGRFHFDHYTSICLERICAPTWCETMDGDPELVPCTSIAGPPRNGKDRNGSQCLVAALPRWCPLRVKARSDEENWSSSWPGHPSWWGMLSGIHCGRRQGMGRCGLCAGCPRPVFRRSHTAADTACVHHKPWPCSVLASGIFHAQPEGCHRQTHSLGGVFEEGVQVRGPAGPCKTKRYKRPSKGGQQHNHVPILFWVRCCQTWLNS